MKHFAFLFCILILSCSNNKEKEPISEEKSKEFIFEGLSIFKKNSSIQDIITELNKNGIDHFLISNDNEELYAFDVPYECCPEIKILYLPSYKFGDLYLNSLFLLFHEEKLALIRTNLIQDGNILANNVITEFKD